MPADDVAALLDRWGRARTRSQQLQVAAAGARTLRSSSPADRRVLAQALVEHGAPQVAAQLDTASSGPLSAADLTDLVGALRGVEPATLEAVAAAVADPLEHQRLLATADGWVDGAPWSDAPPPPPTGAPTGPAVELPPPAAIEHVEEPGTEHVEEPDPEPSEPDPEVAHEPAEAAPADLVLDDLGSDEPYPDEPGPGPDEPDPVEPAPVEPAPDPEGADPAPIAGGERPGDVDVGGVLTAIERSPRVLDRLREVTELGGEPLRGEDLVTILRALPDGWQRRTAAKRLLAAGGARDVDAAALLGVLGRASDRTAVARTLVATGLADVGTVRDHLPATVAARLVAATSRT